MTSQPSTVEVDGFSITSHEDADQMLENLKPEKADSGEARITVRGGQAVPIPEPKDKISEAASELGKKGGQAAAAKRAEEAKKAKAEPEEKPADSEDESADEAKAGEAEDEAADIKKPSVKKRIETLARERDEAKQRADQERRERERLANEVERLRTYREQPREQPQERKAPERQPAAQDDPEPKLDDFEDYAEFVSKKARWEARQEFKEQQQRMARQAQAHAFATRVQGTLSTYAERIKAARASDPDFSTRISPEVKQLYPSVDLQPGEPLRAGNVIADYIVHSEQAPALLLHLSENPQDFQRIASLGGPRDVERAMAKLEGRLDAATAGTRVETEEVSQAKPPLRPVSGSPHTAADIEPDAESDDFDTWNRKMDAKEKRNSKR